ncbi:MAG: hypothetical protein H0V51_12580, partial [Chloroflexi bacterium]|nr:hypothetical protein [Chloroflexota bacterium]
MIDQDVFGRALRTLEDGETPPSEELGALSHLEGEQLTAFEGAWRTLSTIGRARLLARLHDAEREHLRWSFSTIYAFGFDDPDATIRRQALRSTVEDTSPRLLEAIVRLARGDSDVD